MEVRATYDDTEVRALLNRSRRDITSALVAWAEDVSSFAMRNLTTYPPKPPGSRYVRTNNLRGSWHVTPIVVTDGEVRTSVVSNGNVTLTRSGETYNRLVQDADRQARVHRGRWTNTAQEVTRRAQENSPRYLQARLAVIGG